MQDGAMTTATAHRTGPLAHLGVDSFSVPEAGRILGIGRNHAYALAAEGKLPALRLGKKLRVTRISLERLMESAGVVTPDLS